MIKGSITQEDLTIINWFETKYKLLKDIKQKLTKLTRKTDVPILGGFKTLFYQ